MFYILEPNDCQITAITDALQSVALRVMHEII